MDNDILLCLIFFVLLSILIYIFNIGKLSTLQSEKKKKKKSVTFIEFEFLKYRYDVDVDKLKNKRMIFLLSVINSFIISVTFVTVVKIPLDTIWQLLIAFVLIFGLIYSLYEILGKILVKKGYKK